MKALIFAIVVSFCLPLVSAKAAVGEWFVSDGAKLRLVTLRDGVTGKLSAALQIVLEQGWKTYWRSPGSSGIPPQLDFSQSTNVSFLGIRFPTPVAFSDGIALTSGYKNEVILPLDVETLFPQQDAVLKVTGLIGVCEQICIPVKFSTEVINKAAGGSSFEAAQVLASANSSLPEATNDRAKLLSVKVKKGRLEAEAIVPNGTKHATLFVEGPYNWYLSPAKATKIDAGKAWFSIAIPEKIKPGEASGTVMRATLVVDGKGYEQEIAVR